MPASRIVWSWLVTALGLLWTLGGFLGGLKESGPFWLMFLLGLGLLRLGSNLRKPAGG